MYRPSPTVVMIIAVVATWTCLPAGRSIAAGSQLQAAEVILDAAKLDRDGGTFVGFVAIRPIVDNSKGLQALTGIRFEMEIHSGAVGGIAGWGWEDPANPWYGVRPDDSLRPDGASYTQGIVYYPQTEQWAPAFFVDPTPADPTDWQNDYSIMDSVPAGMVWDYAVKILGAGGADIDVFSTARGDLTSDQLNLTVYDSDPMPQTVPEPGAIGLIALGVLGVIARCRKMCGRR